MTRELSAKLHCQVSRRELTNLRTYKGTVSRLVERVSKIRQVLPHNSFHVPHLLS